MKLDIRFDGLDALIRRMGASPRDWRSDGGIDPHDFAARLKQGIEVDPSEVEIGPAGLFTYKGQHVLLYIMDSRHDRDTLENRPEKAQRFHLTECDALDRMRGIGRLDRYVVTNDTSGTFRVVANDWVTGAREETRARLKVCRLCLKKLRYRGYEGGTGPVWRNFSLDEFFAHYATHFAHKPRYTDATMPPQGYTADWPELSRRHRERVGWRCQQCGVDLSGHGHLLHVHHRNGLTADNSTANLRALCVLCHAEQPLHAMRVPPAQAETIRRLRAAQGK
ncbi:MAG: hypothetical protein AB1918_10070 [Pseudomonadota bacterium]